MSCKPGGWKPKVGVLEGREGRKGRAFPEVGQAAGAGVSVFQMVM